MRPRCPQVAAEPFPGKAVARPQGLALATQSGQLAKPHLFQQNGIAMDEHLKQLLSLGREHYHLREFDLAEAVLQQITAETDRFADVYDMLGVIAHSRGDFPGAEEMFGRAIELNPNYTEALLNLVVTLNDQGKYSEARRLYARVRALGADPSHPDPFAVGKIANMHAQTAQAYQDAGMLADAVAELEKAVVLRPSFADLRTRLALLYRDTGDVARAKEQLQAAKAASPGYVQARVLLGVMLLTGGEREAAQAEFQAVLDTDPENKNAQMYLRLAASNAWRSDRPDGDPLSRASKSESQTEAAPPPAEAEKGTAAKEPAPGQSSD